MEELERIGRTSTRGGMASTAAAAISAPATRSSETAYHLRLRGRILIPGAEEEACFLRWVMGKIGRVEITRSDGSLAETVGGGRAVLYLELIGRLEGTVSRINDREVDLAISAPTAKWLRLQQQFSMLAAMPPSERENVRGFRRIVLDLPLVALGLTDGKTAMVSVQDISRSGAAVKASVLPEPGSIVTLGTTRGRVVRQFADGFAVQFLRLLPLERFGPSYGL